MKRILYSLLVAGLTMLSTAISAATFTAVQNGNWSADATWGGTAPSFNNIADEIIIPAGIVVNLDGDAQVNGLLASLDVDGRLESTMGSSLLISQGLLTGNGEIELDRIEFGSTANSTFDGMFFAEVLVTNSFNLFVNGWTEVKDSLIMMSGTLDITSNDTVYLHDDCVVWADNGSISGQGHLMSNGQIDVYYSGTNYNAGMEMNDTLVENATFNLDGSDNRVRLTNDASVSGLLKLENGGCDLNGHKLVIAGDYEQASSASLSTDDQSSLAITSMSSLTSSIAFDQNSNEIDSITINFAGSGNASFDSDARVISSIMLVNGDMSIESGSNFSTANNATIWINEGRINLNGNATFTNESAINVTYTGSSKETGAEIMSGTVAKLWIDLDNEDASLTLMNNVIITDSTTVEDGWIKCNSYDLGLSGYTNSESMIHIDGDSESELWLNGSFEDSAMIVFAAEDSLKKLIMECENNEHVWTSGNLMITDSLNLNSGILVVNNSNLSLADTGAISGGSEDAYIITEGYSRLQLMIEGQAQSATYFPVGDEDGFCPIHIANAESTDGVFGVNLNSVVLTEGTAGYDVSNTEKVVNKTWDIQADAQSQLDLTLTTEWTSAMEVNGFDRTNAYISHYVDGEWDVVATSSAQTTGNGTYSMSRSGISSLSPFSVQNPGAVGVEEQALTSGMHIFPNPVLDVVTIDVSDQNVEQVTIHDLSGAQVQVVNLGTTSNRTNVDLSDLNSGVYFMNFINGEESVAVERIVKQ